PSRRASSPRGRAPVRPRDEPRPILAGTRVPTALPAPRRVRPPPAARAACRREPAPPTPPRLRRERRAQRPPLCARSHRLATPLREESGDRVEWIGWRAATFAHAIPVACASDIRGRRQSLVVLIAPRGELADQGRPAGPVPQAQAARRPARADASRCPARSRAEGGRTR